ncbi:PLP-dependent aminotransferase family protein [Thaumasiovibrio subtropicus]|uniref:MocR-like pyridoxine biosynthesis transcription factor PdxR n=1 Tax=Thaumasiovibrio subtropicus TaxID=1891207 RepID=UPI000B35A720|nr:PLP-dependent aminotransferase family protein [Thaumasiovibrio subtropicus]
MAVLHFHIDKTASAPLFEQLCHQIRHFAHQSLTQEVSRGAMAPFRLPSTRALSLQLGISRATVVQAYDQLTAEGYIESKQGSGCYLCPVSHSELNPPSSPLASSHAATPKPHAAQAKPLLVPGKADMSLFPHRQWAASVAHVCRYQPQQLTLCDDLFGQWDLRQEIANYVKYWRGIDATPEQILITAGSTAGIALCFRTLAKPKIQVGIESPCYAAIHRHAEDTHLHIDDLPIDNHGAQLPNANTRLAVITPSHQYPLGGAMHPQRRQAFIDWANHPDHWLIEDDYDSEFRYAGHPIPALASLDHHHKTLYLGSFSKLFSNQFRLGYLILPPTLITPFRQQLQSTSTSATVMPQQPLAHFLREGHLYRYLRRARRHYAERYRYLVQLLKERASRYGKPAIHHAGMSLVFHLNPDIPDKQVAERLSRHAVNPIPLSRFPSNDGEYNGLLLGFTHYSFDEIEKGIERLIAELS